MEKMEAEMEKMEVETSLECAREGVNCQLVAFNALMGALRTRSELNPIFCHNRGWGSRATSAVKLRGPKDRGNDARCCWAIDARVGRGHASRDWRGCSSSRRKNGVRCGSPGRSRNTKPYAPVFPLRGSTASKCHCANGQLPFQNALNRGARADDNDWATRTTQKHLLPDLPNAPTSCFPIPNGASGREEWGDAQSRCRSRCRFDFRPRDVSNDAKGHDHAPAPPRPPLSVPGSTADIYTSLEV